MWLRKPDLVRLWGNSGSIRPRKARLQVSCQDSEGVADAEEHNGSEHIKEERQVKIGRIGGGGCCDKLLQLEYTTKYREQGAILHQCDEVVGKRGNSYAERLGQHNFAHNLARVQTQ